MISLGTNTGAGSVSVRVDDLSEQDRQMVRLAIQYIQNMSNAKENPKMGGVSGIVLSFCIVLATLKHTLGLGVVNVMLILAVLIALCSFIGWALASGSTKHYHNKMIVAVVSLTKRSARCNDLVCEYSETNPWFKQLLVKRSTQSVVV